MSCKHGETSCVCPECDAEQVRIAELEKQLADKCPDVWAIQVQNRNIVHENLDLKEKAKHWEDTCHAQWESSQQSVDDCNRLTKENHKLREAIQKIAEKPSSMNYLIAKQALKEG